MHTYKNNTHILTDMYFICGCSCCAGRAKVQVIQIVDSLL